MLDAIPYVLSALFIVGILYERWRLQRAWAETQAQYELYFPGGCFVCSFYAFGLREGFNMPGTLPPDHRCSERWERWRGVMHPPPGGPEEGGT
jgi:hypothetical protein